MKLQFNSSAPVLRGPNGFEDFTVSVVEAPILISGSSSDHSFYDATFLGYLSATTLNAFKLSVNDSAVFPGHTFVNHTPGVCSVDSSGNVDGIAGSFNGYANGAVSVDAVTPIGIRNVKRTFNSASSNTINTFDSFKSGSLGANVTANINALLNGKTPGAGSQQHFSANNFDVASPAAVLNAGSITSGIDFSGISIFNWDSSVSAYVGRHPMILIGSNHYFGAMHFQAGSGSIGNKAVFKGSDNNYYTATIAAVSTFGNDHVVGYVTWSPSNPVTGGVVKAFKTLPQDGVVGSASNYTTYLSSIFNSDGGITCPMLPALVRSIHSNSLGAIDENGRWNMVCAGFEPSYSIERPTFYFGNRVLTPYLSWAIAIQGWDSGSPIFLLATIGGVVTPILLGAYWTYGGAAWLPYSISAVTTAMKSTAQTAGDAGYAGYSMQTVSLSGFTQFTAQ